MAVTRPVTSSWLRRVVVVAALVGARRAGAQGLEPPPYLEYRVDAIDGRGTSLQAGVGGTVAMATYMRVGAVVAVGPHWRGGETAIAARTDLIARFVLDPFRQAPIGLSFGGGLSVPYEKDALARPYLTAVIDIEGRRHGRLTPAIQLGIGGGTRLGVLLRTSAGQRR